MNNNAKTSLEREINRKLDALAVAIAQLAKGDVDKMLTALEEAWKEEKEVQREPSDETIGTSTGN